MDSSQVVARLDDLRHISVSPFFLYTDSNSGSEEERHGCSCLQDPPIHHLLGEMGFVFDPHRADRDLGYFGMFRESGSGRSPRYDVISYHPLYAPDPAVLERDGFNTRVNFYFLRQGATTWVYEVAKGFLDRGHRIAVPEAVVVPTVLSFFKKEGEHYASVKTEEVPPIRMDVRV